jgi:hypothetical protein
MTENIITYYDFAEIGYSSYFVNGFAENAGAYRYRFRVSRRMPSILQPLIGGQPYRTICFCICLFSANLNGEKFFFCIDTHDSAKSCHQSGPGYHLPLLAEMKYYFKLNYNGGEIEKDSRLRQHKGKIFPTTVCFPIAIARPDLFLRAIFCRTRGQWDPVNAKKRVTSLIQSPSLKHLRNLRNSRKVLDIFFVNHCYGESHPDVDLFRCKVIDEIRKHSDLNAITGFSKVTIRRRNHSLQLGPYGCERYRKRKYLRNLANAKIGIYVRGTHNCTSFRFGELQALGLPIVGQPLANNQELFYNIPNWSRQFSFETPSEIVGEIRRLLKRPDEISYLSKMNGMIFDTRFTPKAVVSDILNCIIKTVNDKEIVLY